MSNYDSVLTGEEQARALLSGRLRRVLDADHQAAALMFGDETFTWGFFAQAVTDLEALLSSQPDSRRIGIVLRNRPGPLAASVATIATGRSLITLSPHLGDVGLSDDIRDLKPDVIVADHEDWARESLRAAAAEVGALPLCSGQDAAFSALPATWPIRPALLPANDVAVLMMTSGTTGRPKRVTLTYRRMVAAFRAAGTPVDDQSEPRLHARAAILWASLAHISGLYFAVAYAAEGRSVALLEKFEVKAWADLVRKYRPAIVRLAPTALRMVYDANVPLDVFDGVKAVGSGSAPLPVDLAAAFEERYGVPVLGTYGATEFAGAIAGWSLKDKKRWGNTKAGSVGRTHPGIELQILDQETSEPLPVGAIGVLAARGGQIPTDGAEWLTTTDLASLDDDGFLYIHGRSDDAINRGGFKIPPSVIEDAILQHPAVADACAVGLPDERLGEVPAVAVMIKDEVTEDELKSYLAERLTRYQQPARLLILADLPRTPSMKVSRPRVRDEFLSTTS